MNRMEKLRSRNLKYLTGVGNGNVSNDEWNRLLSCSESRLALSGMDRKDISKKSVQYGVLLYYNDNVKILQKYGEVVKVQMTHHGTKCGILQK